MSPEEFRIYGHAVVDWIADYRARLETLPVMAKTAPGEVRAMLPDSPPLSSLIRNESGLFTESVSKDTHCRRGRFSFSGPQPVVKSTRNDVKKV